MTTALLDISNELDAGTVAIYRDVAEVAAALRVVCSEPKARRTDDGIDNLPFDTFVQRLWAGELI